jgi:hypothetical protein
MSYQGAPYLRLYTVFDIRILQFLENKFYIAEKQLVAGQSYA